MSIDANKWEIIDFDNSAKILTYGVKILRQRAGLSVRWQWILKVPFTGSISQRFNEFNGNSTTCDSKEPSVRQAWSAKEDKPTKRFSC